MAPTSQSLLAGFTFLAMGLFADCVGQVTIDRAGLRAAHQKSLDEHPKAVREVRFGSTVAEQPLRGLLVALPGEIAPELRPRILVVAGLHPDHQVGIAVASRLAPALLLSATTDASLAATLSRVSVEMVPAIAIDQIDGVASKPLREHRRNLRPVDDDRDGFLDEDGPEDLNGDGVISWMRVRSARGQHRTSPEDPRLIVPADKAKGEATEWLLLEEGVDSDGDGEVNEDAPGGVDFDRNFPHGWREHDPAAGAFPLSEKEVRSLADHVLATRSLAAVIVLGRRDNVGRTPEAGKAQPAGAPNGPHGDDRAFLDRISGKLRGHLGITAGDDDPIDGGFHHWTYAQLGIPSFAMRTFWRKDPDPLPELPSGKKPESEEARWLSFSDRELGGRGFLEWKKHNHPEFGEVEIGGFVPLSRINPPEAMLTDLVERQVRCVAEVAAALPMLEWADVSVRRITDEVHEIRATLTNKGGMPAPNTMERVTKSTLPIRAHLDAKEADILDGKNPQTAETLQAHGGTATFTWLLRRDAGGTVRLRALCERYGQPEVTINL